MKQDGTPLFYVQLRDNFAEECSKRKDLPSFPGMDDDPYLEAREQLTPGRTYPVLEVPSSDEILILNDRGVYYKVNNHLFKFTEPERPVDNSL